MGPFISSAARPRSLRVSTPFVNGAVEGTEFVLQVDAEAAYLTVFQGRVTASNTAGSLTLQTGESAVARRDLPPALRIVVRPRDAVQWALYYPPVIDPASMEGFYTAPANRRRALEHSLERYGQGDVEGALEAIETLAEEYPDAGVLTYRAGLLLRVGRSEEATDDLQQALQLEPAYAEALALQAVMAVVLNRATEALTLARQAVEAGPDSLSARLALSYAQQAYFEIDAALASVEEAVGKHPDSALGLARLAEVRLMKRDLDGALESASRAVEANPRLALTHTVLGFAYLVRMEPREASSALKEAIRLDEADPMPRLGLGLAKIRQGNLAEGRTELEIAVTLDPNNALLRSYLGKAYFEEKRDKLAAKQLAVAKELDPLDPTAWFYEAIRKQTVNRPVEALHDLQKSTELNDNRAVYRSRLLLDEDLAARSASLGRIYRDLGFEQLALVEGWKSLNADPANYSAHRFLADTYSALPRHEIARVSELLQSQLLQPINITPVQPRLAESNLRILEGAGPAEPAFNEFNPLLLRNRVVFQGSGLVGSNDTWGDELTLSGAQDRLSFSLGRFHYETEGFRENNDLDQDIFSAFFQAAVAPQTGIQAEYRYRKNANGDLALRFDKDDFVETLRQEDRTRSLRFGFHHAFRPYSDLVASLIYQRLDSGTTFSEGIVDADITTDDDAYSGEVQHACESERFSTVVGIGHVHGDTEILTSTAVMLPGLPPQSSLFEQDFDIRHTNAYIYSYLRFPTLTWTIGASADFFEGGLRDREQFNPKLGLTWEVFPSTALRAAAFRTLKRILLTNQTVEPTQVSGFNQFFDDGNETDAWRYGVALDHKFSMSLSAGAEFSYRELEFPFEEIPLPPASPRVRTAEWTERVGRAYLYWAPHRWLAASAEYLYERFGREAGAGGEGDFTELTTHRLPLGVRFFHPSGFAAHLKATYVHQEGEFGDPAFAPQEQKSDDFWTVDAALSYRLPQRYGLFSVGVRNLLNENHQFLDTDPSNPSIYPERFFFAKLTLAF